MSGGGTERTGYTDRLLRKESVWWKRLLDVQRPYRWNLRRLEPGRTLDIGCGLGRNLAHLDGNGVGVDHNPDSVAVCRDRGFTAYRTEEFGPAYDGEHFDSILLSHVVEHMTRSDAVELIREYLPYLRPGGKVIAITPQESGFRSDPTHVEFVDFEAGASILERAGCRVVRQQSFPFPRRLFGKVFRYNEFVTVGVAPDGSGPATA
jgi:SAM-dependent methyltransferase